jgi:hypothetical protein
MSKRNPGAFERRDNDAYTTPPKALWPLALHLRQAHIHTFAEPCAGDGALVIALEQAGFKCRYAGDIQTGQDALQLTVQAVHEADVIITNPPYERVLMHRLIEVFRRLKPTWLLLEADWLFTVQSAPFMLHCSDIVPIGRVRWIPGSGSDGFDNYCWARFDMYPHDTTRFHRLVKS